MSTQSIAADLREQGHAAYAAASESFDRCDTDGFLSQAASQITGARRMLEAELVEGGGQWTFPALFDTDGNLVPAKLVTTRYGIAWGLLADDDPQGAFVGWFNESRARTDDARIAANARKGYSVGLVRAAGVVRLTGGGQGLGGLVNCRPYVARADGGFSRDVEVVETTTRYDN